MTVVNLDYIPVAERGVRLLETALRQAPPAGIAPESVERFFERHRGDLMVRLARLLEKQLYRTDVESTAGPEYTTPGTSLSWRTLRQWLWAQGHLRHRAPSLANHEALVAHFAALPDALVLAGSEEELDALVRALRWIRPPKGQRKGHLSTHLKDVIEQARQRLRSRDEAVE